MSNEFTCAMCGYIGEKRAEEEALAELAEEFGADIIPDECDVVCDDCWETVRPGNNPLWFEACQLLREKEKKRDKKD